MRISDWSSDVCSSDLWSRASRRASTRSWSTRRGRKHRPDSRVRALPVVASAVRGAVVFFRAAPLAAANHALPGAHVARDAVAIQRNLAEMNRSARSEEHTSELQSLMRISYAVFCLKKKLFIFSIYFLT